MANDDDDVCIICLDQRKCGDKIVILPCHHNHKFHEECFDQHFKTNMNCCLCKRDFLEI